MKRTGTAVDCAEASPLGGSTADRIAERLLAGPIAFLLGLICLLQLLTWIPHYLTWPLWADHDVFATLARGWAAGRLPYRDLYCNQFPGAIYLFWVLGRLTGWGESAPLYAFDAGAIIVLGLTLLAWSKRLFGTVQPGIVGYLSFLSYYLSLDYSLAAQRDWHAPLLAVLGILILQASKGGSLAPAFSGVATALALTIRPQAVLFLPAVAIQLFGEMRSGTSSRRLRVWVVSWTITILLLFTPLVVSGIVPDFLEGIGHNYAAREGRAARVVSMLVVLLGQFGPFGNIAVCLAAFVLPKPDRKQGLAAMVWLAAFLLVLFYKPISPTPHHYLNIPLTLVLAVNMAVVAQLLLSVDRIAPIYKLLAFLLLLGISCKMRPDFCTFRPSLRAAAPAMWDKLTSIPPPGYRRGPVPTAAYYRWADYQSLLDYLRRVPSRQTKIANALKGDAAIVGPLGRLPAFPAESVAWLRMVDPSNEAGFAKALEDEPDSLVVWSPRDTGPDPSFAIDLIESAILRLYEPDVRFGPLEVWRRKGTPSQEGTNLTHSESASMGRGAPSHPPAASDLRPGPSFSGDRQPTPAPGRTPGQPREMGKLVDTVARKPGHGITPLWPCAGP